MSIPLKPWPSQGKSLEDFVLYPCGMMYLDGCWVAKDTKIFKMADEKDKDGSNITNARKLSKLVDKMEHVNYDLIVVQKIRSENAALF
jgi:hypothetical protein